MTTPGARTKAIGHGARPSWSPRNGINHGGDLEAAERLVRAAAAAGADAVKFQTYHTANRVPSGSPLFPLLRRCELSYEAQTHLKLLAESLGIAFFSTPFDQECADFLDDLGVPASTSRRSTSSTGRSPDTCWPRGGSSSPRRAWRAGARLTRSSPARRPHRRRWSCCTASRRIPRRAARGTPAGHRHPALAVRRPRRVLGPHARDRGPGPRGGRRCRDDREALHAQWSPGGPDHALSADPAQLRALVARARAVERILGSDALGCREIEQPIAPYRRFA